jgi:hypothetical protein
MSSASSLVLRKRGRDSLLASDLVVRRAFSRQNTSPANGAHTSETKRMCQHTQAGNGEEEEESAASAAAPLSMSAAPLSMSAASTHALWFADEVPAQWSAYAPQEFASDLPMYQ